MILSAYFSFSHLKVSSLVFGMENPIELIWPDCSGFEPALLNLNSQLILLQTWLQSIYNQFHLIPFKIKAFTSCHKLIKVQASPLQLSCWLQSRFHLLVLLTIFRLRYMFQTSFNPTSNWIEALKCIFDVLIILVFQYL